MFLVSILLDRLVTLIQYGSCLKRIVIVSVSVSAFNSPPANHYPLRLFSLLRLLLFLVNGLVICLVICLQGIGQDQLIGLVLDA